MYCSTFKYRVKDIWSHRFRPRADLAVIRLPQISTLVWVEVQDSILSEGQWKEKIQWSSKMSEELFVVITPNLINDLSAIRDIMKGYCKKSRLFIADPRAKTLVSVSPDGTKAQIEFDSVGKILERRVKDKLNAYFRVGST